MHRYLPSHNTHLQHDPALPFIFGLKNLSIGKIQIISLLCSRRGEEREVGEKDHEHGNDQPGLRVALLQLSGGQTVGVV